MTFKRDRDWDVLEYDVTKYPFRQLVAIAIEEDWAPGALEKLAFDKAPVFKREQDQSTPWHRLFYSNKEAFLGLYRSFVRHEIAPLFTGPIVYQTIPSFRIHLRNNVAVGEFHRDTDYGHSPDEINFWLPVTKAYDSNTVLFTPHDGSTHMVPADLEYGQVLVFNAGRLHGNKVNKTEITRVSFDFRAFEKSLYAPTGKKSINTGLKFEIGGYFSEFS